jgi:8-oxo-dGTP diphosphatase
MEQVLKKGIDYTGISVVFFCHDGNGNFLLSKRSNQCRDEHGNWEPGSGGLDYGDSIDGTLTKEIAEEYGTEAIDQEFIGYRDIYRIHESKQTHWLSLDFLVRLDPLKVRNGEPHKHEEIGWFKLENFPEPLHSQFPVFLEKYAKRFERLIEESSTQDRVLY